MHSRYKKLATWRKKAERWDSGEVVERTAYSVQRAPLRGGEQDSLL
jgi:hypothetical protein